MSKPLLDQTERRRASRLLRCHGVCRAQRKALLDDVLAELNAATADGSDSSSVLGVDRDAELLSWAKELGITGRTAQLPKIVGSVLIAASVALTLALIATFADAEPGQLAIGIYFVSVVVCDVGSGGLATRWLRRGSDRRARATQYSIMLILPIAGIAAAAAGWLVARESSFRLDGSTIAAVLAAVFFVLVAAAVGARLIALRVTGYHAPAAPTV